jgi:hypothetical protein
MSHITCITCGLQCPISAFDPSKNDLDIYLVTKKGKGRGRGWEDVSKESVLGDDVYTPVVAERTLEICKLFHEKGIISDEDLESIKNGGTKNKPLLSEIDILNINLMLQDNEIRKLKYECSSIKSENSRLRIKNNEIEESQTREKEELFIKNVVTKSLLIIIKHCDVSIDVRGEEEFSIMIENISPVLLFIITYLKLTLNDRAWGALVKRIDGTYEDVQFILDFWTRPLQEEIYYPHLRRITRSLIDSYMHEDSSSGVNYYLL